MAVNALMVVVLILVVVTVFGIAVIYNRRKRKASVCGSRSHRNGARIEEGLTSATAQSALALVANGLTNTGTTSSIESSSTGHTAHLGLVIDNQERPQCNHLRRMNPASPLPVNPSGSEFRSVATERCGSMQPSTPRACSTAVFSSPLSARNRHHGSVLVGASNPVINPPGLSLGPPSVQIPATPACQPTIVPTARHAVHEAIRLPTESNDCQPPILLDRSLPIIQGIRIVRHPPAVLRPIPPARTGEANHSEFGGPPSGSHIRTLIEPSSSAPSRLNAGANPSSLTPNNHPVETQIGSALSRQGAEGCQEDTGETETEDAALSNMNLRLPTTVSRPQFPPEPQERLDQVGSTSSNRLLGNVTATTDSTSSGTSAAAETSLSSVSSVSDRRGQQQASSFRDGRRRSLENPPAEGEADPTELSTEVEEVVPHKGPTTGGVSIIILGYNFPSVPLYIRFGGFITRTTWRNEATLRCILPPASRPGKVKVTLSQAPSHNSPEFGRSFAHFEYEDERIITLYSLLQMVLKMLDGRPLENIFTSIQQRLDVIMGSSTDAHVHRTQEHGGSLTAHLHFQLEELEDLSICFLSAHSEAKNWKQFVSLQNKSGQTMAHMAVMLGYLRLLGSLIEWGIDLNLTDFNGSTALHYAFLCNESACAILLIRSGADELALDELGRSAWDLNPSLVDEFASRLRGIPKIDGTFSVSCYPAEEEWEMERPEESATLEANYLLMQRWIQRMEEGRGDTNDLHSPQSGISPPCLPSYPGYGTDLTIEQKRFCATHANQSTGTVPKIPPLSNDLHLDSQSINSSLPQYSEWDETNHAQSLMPTPSAASNRASTTSLTDEEVRQTVETWIESSEWCQNDELGPLVGAPQACVQQDSEYLDEPETYFPVLEGTLLLSDGGHFYEVQPAPGSSAFLFEVDTDFASSSPTSTTSIHHLPNHFPPTSAAPAVRAIPPGDLPPPSPFPEITEIVGPQPALSDTVARAHIMAYILDSVWFRSHEMEPCVSQPGVPDCALQLAKPEWSIWACLFKRVRRRGVTVLKCVECGHETPRLNRAVGHQRAKWEHKPFACTNPGCDFRGSTNGSVTDHRSPRAGTTPCSACGEAIVIKRLPRHLLNVHSRE